MAVDLTHTLIFRGGAFFKLAFARVLRQIFANDQIVKDKRYRYSETEADTKIRIYRALPQRMEHFPCVVVSIGDYDASLKYMGLEKEEVTAHTDDSGILVDETFGGSLILPVVLRIYSKESQIDRDNLRDLLVQILRVLGRSYFARYGAGWSTISAGGDEQEEDGDGKIIHTANITIQVNTDYIQMVKIDAQTLGLINAVVVDVFGKEDDDSARYPLHA